MQPNLAHGVVGLWSGLCNDHQQCNGLCRCCCCWQAMCKVWNVWKSLCTLQFTLGASRWCYWFTHWLGMCYNMNGRPNIGVLVWCYWCCHGPIEYI